MSDIRSIKDDSNKNFESKQLERQLVGFGGGEKSLSALGSISFFMSASVLPLYLMELWLGTPGR